MKFIFLHLATALASSLTCGDLYNLYETNACCGASLSKVAYSYSYSVNVSNWDKHDPPQGQEIFNQFFTVIKGMDYSGMDNIIVHEESRVYLGDYYDDLPNMLISFPSLIPVTITKDLQFAANKISSFDATTDPLHAAQNDPDIALISLDPPLPVFGGAVHTSYTFQVVVEVDDATVYRMQVFYIEGHPHIPTNGGNGFRGIPGWDKPGNVTGTIL